MLGVFSTHALASTTEDHRALMIAGQVMRNDGKLLRARDILTTCRDAPCDDTNAECEDIRRYCATKGAEITAEIPTVALRVVDERQLPVHATLRVDASIVELEPLIELDPGHHILRAAYAGVGGATEVDLSKGQRGAPATIMLDLRRSVTSRDVPWSVFFFGVVTAVASFTAVGFAIAANAQASELGFCKPTCDPSRNKDVFAGTTVTVDASLIVAAASGLATLVAYLTRPTRTHVVHVEVRVGP